MRLGTSWLGAMVGAMVGAMAGAMALIPAIAAAEAPRRTVAPESQASLYDVAVGPETADGYLMGRQLVPPASATTAGTPTTALTAGGTAGLAASRTIYLNKNGVTLSPGANDSITNRSTVVTQPTVIPAWNVSDAVWASTVSCMREVFAPFNVTITDKDPGSVPHMEAVFGGAPTMVGQPTNLAGVSPFTTDCSIIENSITFAFMGVLPADPMLACEVMAQEVAHSYGLDHVMVATEVMTYLPYEGRRWFQNLSASCGEDKARPCGLNGSMCRQNQNSVALLIERLGLKAPAGDAVAPTVSITSPQSTAVVPPTFNVKFNATDNTKVTMVSLYIDGVPSGSVMGAPFSIPVPSGLAEGSHQLRVVATDGSNEQAKEIAVTVKKGAASPDGEDDVVGGCTAGGGAGGAGGAAGLGLALAALARRRRR
ncbi:MAG TPA: Ig-like domain-containing protein [Kofleriaceae bacterium]|nr:Ig-like domain-containing protein [Kofleriaceae bacterium]